MKKRKRLTEDQVGAIRFGIWCGIQNTSLARQFGVDQSCISDIKRGKLYVGVAE